MVKLNINGSLCDIEKIYMIGIGGISMSALAGLLTSYGCSVSGSDFSENPIIATLQNNGIDVHLGHNADNITDPDLVCYTAAISEENPELVAARARGIPVMERADLLGEIMKLYKYPVAISGTHGKTTSTAMLSLVLLRPEIDPTILVGGEFAHIGGNLRIGNMDYFIFEACEYVESFLKFNPYITIINNIEEDHMDYFKDIEHIIASFRKFADRTIPDGAIVANYDDENIRRCLEGINRKVITYGIDNPDCDFTASGIKHSKTGVSYDVYYKNEFYGHIKLQVSGEHNIYNSLSAIAAAYFIGIKGDAAAEALCKFTGVKRRFESYGKTQNGVTIIDDYAHHPTEIAATLSMAKELGYNKVWCVFQSHTYTRTAAFAREFAKSLSIADCIVLADIYAAREVNIHNISNQTITEHMKNKEVYCLRTFKEIADYINNNAHSGDLVITMGAGDVYKVAEYLTKNP